jgi:hypothetical protein
MRNASSQPRPGSLPLLFAESSGSTSLSLEELTPPRRGLVLASFLEHALGPRRR